jgi:hypothetical protein
MFLNFHSLRELWQISFVPIIYSAKECFRYVISYCLLNQNWISLHLTLLWRVCWEIKCYVPLLRGGRHDHIVQLYFEFREVISLCLVVSYFCLVTSMESLLRVILIRHQEEKGSVGRPRCRWDDNIKMGLKGNGKKVTYWRIGISGWLLLAQ